MRIRLMLATLIWGLNIVVMKLFLKALPPFKLAVLRVLLSAIVTGLLAYFKHVPLRPTKSDVPTLIKIGWWNVTCNFSLSYVGLSLVEGHQVALINALAPLVMCFLTPSKPRKWLGLGLVMLGFGVSFRFDWQALKMGHLLMFLSLCSYQYSLYAMSRLKMERTYLTFWSLVWGGLGLIWPTWLLEGWSWQPFMTLSLSSWLWFLLFAVVGFAYIQLTYAKATAILGPLTAGFYSQLAIVFTYLGSLFFLKEPFDIAVAGGIGLMVAGFLIQRKSAQRADSSSS